MAWNYAQASDMYIFTQARSKSLCPHYWRLKYRQGDKKPFVVCAHCGHHEEVHE